MAVVDSARMAVLRVLEIAAETGAMGRLVGADYGCTESESGMIGSGQER